MSTPPTGFDEAYLYDGLNRLIKMNRGDLASGTITDANAGFSQAWAAWDTDHWKTSLDAVGNWTEFKEDSDGGGSGDSGWSLDQNRAHNKVNEIDGHSGNPIWPQGGGEGWQDPTYDDAGNQTLGPKPGAETTDAEAHHYVYDAWNRLVEVWEDKDGDGTLDDEPDDTHVLTCRYDGLGRRIQKVVEGDPDVTYDYYYSGYQVVEVRKDGDSDPYEQYVWDMRYVHSPVLRWRDTTSPPDGNVDETLYYTNDANFNVTALVEPGGDVVERVVYDPYGKATFYDGSWENPSSTSAYANDVLYTGHRLDSETGLYYAGARYYHQTLGRWVSRDPGGYADGMSLYEYGMSNPVIGADPLGLIWKVKRAGGSQADVKGCDDTVDNLALGIGLDGQQFRQWLESDDGGPLPASETANIGYEWRKFKIPNTMHAYWAGELGEFGKWWVMWNMDVETLKERGFKVDENQGWTAAQFESYFATKTASKQMHGLFFWGHGLQYKSTWIGLLTDSGKKKAKAIGQYTDPAGLTQTFEYNPYHTPYGLWRPAYNLGLGVLWACGTDPAARIAFSENATFRGFKDVGWPHGFHLYGDTMSQIIPPAFQGTNLGPHGHEWINVP